MQVVTYFKLTSSCSSTSTFRQLSAKQFQCCQILQNKLEDCTLSKQQLSGGTNICRSSLASVDLLHVLLPHADNLHVYSNRKLQKNLCCQILQTKNGRLHTFKKICTSGGTNICRSSLANVDLFHASLITSV